MTNYVSVSNTLKKNQVRCGNCLIISLATFSSIFIQEKYSILYLRKRNYNSHEQLALRRCTQKVRKFKRVWICSHIFLSTGLIHFSLLRLLLWQFLTCFSPENGIINRFSIMTKHLFHHSLIIFHQSSSLSRQSHMQPIEHFPNKGLSFCESWDLPYLFIDPSK